MLETADRDASAFGPTPDDAMLEKVLDQVQRFYKNNPQIKQSHGWKHIQAVYHHACQAIAYHDNPVAVSSLEAMEIKAAALLHDVDDHKYFPTHNDYENARGVLSKAKVPEQSVLSILYMISLVSCSQNGNKVPSKIADTDQYHKLIPRWSDRLEAVGKVGVIRCYQYTQEHKRPLSSSSSPRAQSIDELWKLATPQRFEAYQTSGGSSDDMISHYYDKLLHIACPPRHLVRNFYLERMAQESSKALVEVCLRFGKTGIVDEEYIQHLEAEIQCDKS